MRELLGLELTKAVCIAQNAGKKVKTLEIRSKKGQIGNEKRVVRQTEQEGVVTLTYAVFKTTLEIPD